MSFVVSKAAGVLVYPVTGDAVDTLTIRPGENSLPAGAWAIVKAYPDVAALLSSGTLVDMTSVSAAPPADTGEPIIGDPDSQGM